jgi:hypothetical protein
MMKLKSIHNDADQSGARGGGGDFSLKQNTINATKGTVIKVDRSLKVGPSKLALSRLRQDRLAKYNLVR